MLPKMIDASEDAIKEIKRNIAEIDNKEFLCGVRENRKWHY